MTAIWLPGEAPPRIAFAVGRPVGNAVTRNRVKRQLRAAVAEVHAGAADRTGGIPDGAWLFRAGPGAGQREYQQLRGDLEQAALAVQRR